MTTCDDEAPTPEQQFNTLKNELIAATGSPRVDVVPHGKVHMTLKEWSRLVAIIAAGAVIRLVLNHARNTCEIVEYRVSGKHDTWDSYHEGRAAFADEIWKILDRVELASTETHTPPIPVRTQVLLDEIRRLADQDSKCPAWSGYVAIIAALDQADSMPNE